MAKQTRSVTLTVTFTPAERARVHAAAKADGRSASAFIHRKVMSAMDSKKKGKSVE